MISDAMREVVQDLLLCARRLMGRRQHEKRKIFGSFEKGRRTDILVQQFEGSDHNGGIRLREVTSPFAYLVTTTPSICGFLA
jgi:hypothetical protein